MTGIWPFDGEEDEDHSPFVTISHGLRGWFAVIMWWNAEDGPGFWEPWQSGIGSYKTPQLARTEAVIWAKAEGLRTVFNE